MVELEREQRKSPKVCFCRDSDSVYRPESAWSIPWAIPWPILAGSFRLDAAGDDDLAPARRLLLDEGACSPAAAIAADVEGRQSGDALALFARECPIHVSNNRRAKRQSFAAPVLAKARGAPGISIPSRTRGNAPSPKVRGAERRKARVTFQTPCGARPMTLGVHLAALHCGVFLRPRDRLLKTDRGAHSNTLDPAGLSPCVHPLHQPVAGRTHVIGPGRDSRAPGDEFAKHTRGRRVRSTI